MSKSDNPRVLALIPARGGSKRFPRKNIAPLCGKPLIAWTIEAAKKAENLTDWVVSTEDKEIAQVAADYGAPVLMRPPELATDEVRNKEVMAQVVEFMERGHERYDILMLLQPTSPIRDPKDIDKAVARLTEKDWDAIVSVQALPVKRDQNVKKLFGYLKESDATHIYNGSIYAVRRDYFAWERSPGQLVAKWSTALVMDRYHSIDIDEPIDLKVAELYMQEMGKDVSETEGWGKSVIERMVGSDNESESIMDRAIEEFAPLMESLK